MVDWATILHSLYKRFIITNWNFQVNTPKSPVLETEKYTIPEPPWWPMANH